MAKASEGGISSTVMSWYDTLTNSVPDETIKGVLTGARGSVSSAVESTTTLTQNALSQVNSAVTAVMLPSCHALSTQALSPLVAIPLLSAATAVLWKMTRLRRSYSPSPPHPLHCHSLPLTSRLKVFHSMQMLISGVAIGAAIMITKVLPADNSKDATTTAVSTTLDAIRKVAGLAPAAPVSLQREALSTALTATRRTLAVSVIPYLMHSIVTVYGTKEKEYSGLATRLLRTTHNASIIADVATALFVLNSTGVAPVIKLSSIGLLAAVEILVRGVGIPPQAGAKAIRGVLSSLGVATCLAALVTSRYGVNELGTSAALLRSMFLIGIASLNSRAHSLRTASIAEKRVTLPNVLGLNAAVALWILTWKSKGMCPMIQFGERTVPVAQLLAGAHLLGLGGALGALFFKREIRSLITSPPADPPQPKQTSPLSESWAKEFIFADS